MNTLERLKELAGKATPGPCVGSGAEILPSGDLRYYIDFPGIKTGSVAGSIALGESINALPDLLEVAEAARELRNSENDFWHIHSLPSEDLHFDEEKHIIVEIRDAAERIAEARKRLDAALAKLEAAHD